MPNIVSSDPDAGIRVAITPSQSAYFAGEPFSVTITFTNTRSAEAGPSKPSTYTHKRGAHSISSAPLARPPTSPGTPRTPVAPSIARAKSHIDAPLRRGLVGIPSDGRQEANLTLDQRRKRLLAKSLSVSIAPPEVDTELSQTPSAGSHQRTFQDSYRSPLVPPSIPRTDELPLSHNHPHARKHSVIVDSHHFPESHSSTYPPSMTPNSSTSSFSLALDSIAEASMGPRLSYPNTPILGSPSIEPASPSRFMSAGLPHQHSAYPYPPTSSASSSSSSLSKPARPLNLGLGYPTTNGNGNANHRVSHTRAPLHLPQHPRSAFSSSFPPQQHNAEIILYSYAQLTGSVVITPVPGVTLTQEQALNMKRVKENLLKRSVVGGGSMDINSSLLNRTPSGSEYPSPPGLGGVAGRQLSMGSGHGRTSSLTGALFSMLSPSSLLGSPASPQLASPNSPESPAVPGRWRSSTSSSVSSFSARTPVSPQTPTESKGVGLGLEMGVGMGLPTNTVKSSVIASSSGNRSRRGSSSSTTAATPHSRRSSVSWILGAGENSAGSGVNDTLTHPDAETPLPTFEVQPAMMAVDLVLSPGESRTYTYTVNIPDNLPPTFRGKGIRFSYELVVGLCRAGHSSMGLVPGNPEQAHPGGGARGANVSKLMKVPIRMYNNVVVGRPPKPYNLLWPVDRRMDLTMPSSQAKVIEGEKISGSPSVTLSASASGGSGVLSTAKSPASAEGKEGGLQELVRYTKRLLETLPLPSTPTSTPSENQVPDPDGTSQAVLPPGVSPRDGSSVPVNSGLPSPQEDSEFSANQVKAAAASRENGEAKEMKEAQLPIENPPTEGANNAVTPTSAPASALSPKSVGPISPPDSNPPSPVTSGSEKAKDEKAEGRGGEEEEEKKNDEVDAAQNPNVGPSPVSMIPEHNEVVPPIHIRPPSRRPTSLDLGRETDMDGLVVGGCRESVEILTRTQKKASYDVTKDGVKIAVLTFPKSSYRLGETISGVVELNERKGRARVIQLSAFLEAHESLPSTLLPATANKHLRRTYAEHFSSFLLNTLRTTFSLDIPSDASPAFQTCVGTPRTMTGPNIKVPGGTTAFGGVEWKVRLCLLVGVAGEDADPGTEGVRFKSLVRDGPRGEWGSGWKALDVACPLEKEKPKPKRAVKQGSRPGSMFLGSNNASNDGSGTGTPPLSSGARASSAASWTSFFASYLSPSGEREYHDGDELGDDEDDEGAYQNNRKTSGGFGFFGGSFSSFNDNSGDGADEGYDGIKPDLAGGVGQGVDFGGGEGGWKGVRLEMVECEVPVRVWPGNTAFKAMDVVFEV